MSYDYEGGSFEREAAEMQAISGFLLLVAAVCIGLAVWGLRLLIEVL